MSRIVALDVGDATIGVAASDELRITANPINTIRRSNSIKADVREVEALLQNLDASEVVIGLPLLMSGEEGTQAAKVREFADRLSRRLRIPVVMWDETLSTVEAEQSLLKTDTSRAKRRKVIDQVAAAVILQDYLRAAKKSE